MKVRYLIVIIAFAAAVPAAWPRERGDGGLPAAFALMAGDGRALALGGAGVALDGLAAMYYNPAALATVERNAITSTYRALSFDRRIIEVGYGRPIIAGAGMGITWANASVDDLVGRNYAGNPTEKITNSQNMFVFGFGRPVVLEWLRAGVAGRFYYSAIAEGRASGYGLDGGVRATPWEWITAAASVRDVATGLRWEKTTPDPPREDVPTRGLLGLGLRPSGAAGRRRGGRALALPGRRGVLAGRAGRAARGPRRRRADAGGGGAAAAGRLHRELRLRVRGGGIHRGGRAYGIAGSGFLGCITISKIPGVRPLSKGSVSSILKAGSREPAFFV